MAGNASEAPERDVPSASMLIPPSRVVRRPPAEPGTSRRAPDEALRPGHDDRLAPPARPATGRGHGGSPRGHRVRGWTFLLAVALVTWFGLVRQGLLPTPSAWDVAPPPMATLRGTLGPLLAVAIGAAAGVLIATGSGLSWWGRLLGDVSLHRLRWIPLLGLLGLVGLWLGPVRSSLVPILVLVAGVPAYLRADRAIREVDGRFVDLAGTVGLGRGAMVRHVLVPGALPGLVSGVRLSLAIGWVVLVVSELAAVAVQQGLPVIANGATAPAALLTIVVSTVMWLVADVGLRVVTSKALAWAE